MLAVNESARSAAMQLYDYRRVTRAQFEAFQSPPTGQTSTSPAAIILNTVPESQRSLLLEAGTSVCRIQIGDDIGTGFHLGGGWVVTNTHVICNGNEADSSACCATFHFPNRDVNGSRARIVLFTERYALDKRSALRDTRKDLALVYVPEIVDAQISGLNNVFQRPANSRERVYLIHYGNGIDELPRPQQFSVYENEAEFVYPNEHGNKITVHTAHSRPGSSGAPLLVWDERQRKFIVAGVNFSGSRSSILDSPGYALLYNDTNWLQDTVKPATAVMPEGRLMQYVKLVNDLQECAIKQDLIAEVNKLYDDLQEYLEEHSFVLVVPLRKPNYGGLNLRDCYNIIWNPDCTCNRA